MPAAPTNTMASAQANSGPVDWAQGGWMASKSPPAYRAGAKQRHSSSRPQRASLAFRTVSRPRRL